MCCIALESWFQYKEHVCMVFQRHGLSLYDFLKKNEFNALDYSTIREIAYSIFASLYYLHEGIELIHTDLKPENILFVDELRETSAEPRSKPLPPPASTEIKIIDLGSATFEKEHHSTVISTRHYRAPEVVLQIGWSYPSDIWSVGCILVELYTGHTLFQTHQNLEHLAMMEAVIGSFSSEWLIAHKDDKNSSIPCFFESSASDPNVWTLKLHETSSETKRRVKSLKRLSEIIPSKEHIDFLDFIKKSLDYDPSTRITAEQALDHAYFDCLREKYRKNEDGNFGEKHDKHQSSLGLSVPSMSTSRSTSSSVPKTENNQEDQDIRRDISKVL